MKFYDTEKQLIAENLDAEYRAADSIHPIRLAEKHAFFRKGLKTVAVAYSDVDRVFRRIRAIHANLGCCGGDLNLNYIVFCRGERELAEVEFENDSFAIAAFEQLKTLIPNAAFGKN